MRQRIRKTRLITDSSKRPYLRVTVFLLCVFASWTLPVCHASENTSLNGDTLVSASIGEPKNLIPILASETASADIVSLVFNGLVKYDEHLNIVGDLAERWDISEDKLTLTFYLRKNVRWHDGEPFTARDVEFTYQKLIDPKVPTPYSGDFERVREFKVIDDYTFQVTYKELFSPGLISWSMAIMPKHLLEKEDLRVSSFARSPVGTGPFRFDSWKTADKVILRAHPDYFEGRPHLDRYVYRIIPDTSTLFLELQVENIDLMGLTPLQFKRQTDTPFFRAHYQKFKYPSFGFTFLAYNLDDPKFGDKKVRQALNLAIDKQEIIDGARLGLGQAATGPFPPESWAYNSDIKPAPYDPVRAKELLQEAGWVDHDGDGILDKEKVPFRFTIITNQGNEERKLACEMIQKGLKKIGIDVKIKIVEWSAFLNEFVDKRRFDAILLSWSLSRDPDQYDIWHSTKTRPGEFNFIGYKNPEVDRLLEEGRREFNQEKRKTIYKRFHEILNEDQPYTFLYFAEATPAVHQRFKEIKPAPIGIFYNLIKWYVPRSDQKYRLKP